ncbi:MAG: hypothetical protein ACTSR0_06050 [Candidatus Asgardarchaeia archaeon]
MKEKGWLFKSIFYIMTYALLAILGYKLVSQILLQELITIFSPIVHQISFVSAFPHFS